METEVAEVGKGVDEAAAEQGQGFLPAALVNQQTADQDVVDAADVVLPEVGDGSFRFVQRGEDAADTALDLLKGDVFVGVLVDQYRRFFVERQGTPKAFLILAVHAAAVEEHGAFIDHAESVGILGQSLLGLGDALGIALFETKMVNMVSGQLHAVTLDVVAQQHVHGAFKEVCQLRQKSQIRIGLAALPLGDGSDGYAHSFGKLFLGQTPGFALGADGFIQMDLHGIPSVSCSHFTMGAEDGPYTDFTINKIFF